MKNKLLSLLLIVTLLAVTISVGLPATLAADDDNLIPNGDFSNGYSGWGYSGSVGKTTTESNVQITDTLTAAKAAKIVTKANATFKLYSKNKIKIEKNTSYTMSFWIKMTNIKGFTTHFYEPDYTAKDGTYKTDQWNAADGTNIYTYSYDNGSTRICRTDIRHKWYVAETGNEIGDANGVSMFITRTGSTKKVLTPDFPETTREGEWVQVIHTFETGNSAAHEALATYSFTFPSNTVAGEAWIADVKMYATKKAVDDFYTPNVNDPALGVVSKDVACVNGQPSEITAEAFGENTFDGWFVDGELVSNANTLTFTYDPENPPKYEARFTKAAFGVDGSFETGYTNSQLLAQAVNTKKPSVAGTDWTSTSYLATEKNNSGIYIDTTNDGTWRKATVTNTLAHTGKNSVLFEGQYGYIGYKYSGLTPNTEYILSVYAYMTSTDASNTSLNNVVVTPADESCIVKRSDNTYGTNSATALAYKWSATEWEDVLKGWTKVEITVNTKDNTDVIFWVNSNGTNAKLYLDNFAVKRVPKAFEANVNNKDLGKATSETTNVYIGAEVTVTAESINGGKFLGWYIGDELMSTATTYTFTYEEKFNDLIANFEEGPTTLKDYSFENRYTNNQLLAQSSDLSYSTTDTAGVWTEDLFKTTTKDGDNRFFIDSEWSKWGKALATTEQAHTGSFSIKSAVNSRAVGYRLNGLDKNTNYTVSFYAFTTGTTDSTVNTVEAVTVTDADVSCIVRGENNLLSGRTEAAGALARVTPTDGDCRNIWKKISVNFNTKDSTDVIVWMRAGGAGTALYIDDLTLAFTPKQFKPLSNNSSLGTVTPADYVKVSEGDSITVTATPLDGIDFEGWYVGDELISTEKEFTFSYEDKYQGLTAVFASTPGTIFNGGFEYYQNGQVLASYSNSNDPKYNNNAPWSVQTKYTADNGLNFSVTNAKAHTGEKAGRNNIPYRYTGLDIEGLEPSTEYVVSFWAYITGKDPDPNTNQDKNPKNVSDAFVVQKGNKAFVENSSGDLVGIDASLKYGTLPAQVDCYNKWSKIDVPFTTPDDVSDVTLWINFSGYQAQLYLDDFVIGKPVRGSVSAELGGTASANVESDILLKGTEVIAEAIPFEGNTFAGWYDVAGNLISDEAKYTFIANEDYELIAKFDGYNKPAIDLFAMDGKDGTFENGTVSGWTFYDPNYTSPWCTASVNSKKVLEGNYALELNARYRNSILPLTGLTPNADYRLSFYVNQPDTNSKAKIESIAVIGSEYNHLANANVIFAQTSTILSNTGWNKVDLYFNTGNNTSANLIIRFSAETLDGTSDRLFIDNLSLFSFDAASEVVNGDFNNDKENWIGDGTVVTEGSNKALSLIAGNTVYQDLAVEPYAYYDVTFKAKGKLTLAALDLGKFNISAKNLINSKSYIEVDTDEWNTYTLQVYSGVNQAINFMFGAAENGAMVDDFSVVKNVENAGAVLEHFDFETDRFALSAANANSQFSIYTATSENDPYVHSGSKSLKFTYNELLENTSSIFDEAWLSYQPGIGNNFKVTFKFKAVAGKQAGSMTFAPEYSGEYGVDTGFEHMAMSDDWNTVNFYVNNLNYGAFKLKLASILGGATKGDFYIDDIIIAVAPPMVSEENSKTTYCEALYNDVRNGNFEDPASDENWKDLPSTAKIVKGNALKGSYFLRADKGTEYVVQFKVKPNTEYYFAASVRGTKNTVGSIGITTDKAGKIYYANRDEEPASMIEFDASESGWKRRGFKFVTTGNDFVNVCINVTSGSLDIDSVMLFSSDYGYRYDPNDYTVYVPYDYNNLKSETTVLYGGFGEQPYYTGKIDTDENGLIDGDLDGDGISDDIVLDDSESGEENEDGDGYTDEAPSTGDTTMPVMIIIIAVIASAVLLFATKRKEGANNA